MGSWIVGARKLGCLRFKNKDWCLLILINSLANARGLRILHYRNFEEPPPPKLLRIMWTFLQILDKNLALRKSTHFYYSVFVYFGYLRREGASQLKGLELDWNWKTYIISLCFNIYFIKPVSIPPNKSGQKRQKKVKWVRNVRVDQSRYSLHVKKIP